MVDMSSLKQDALSRMPNKPYHNSNHVKRVVNELKSRNSSKVLIAAGYYHDVGHSNGSDGHEKRSARIARKKMVEYGFSKEQAEKASDAILDTVLFQNPSTRLGSILTDVDTHNFSYNWDKFKRISLKVKKEENPSCSESVWFKDNVLPLLENHTYHTISSYRSGKKSNIERIKREY
jgi:predicted metal-dependent HD superfamily phosphohydrolase